MTPMTIVLCVCGLAVAVLLIAEYKAIRLGIVVGKLAAATCFIAVALLSGALESTYGQILLGGLVLCWIGDACLLSSGRSKGFLAGIGAFLLGHVAYAVAFFELGVDLTGLGAAGLVVAGLLAIVLIWLRPHVPLDFRIAVQAYVGVIGMMLASAFGALLAGAPVALFAGALAFTVSDLFVARERFVSEGFANSALGLPLYFGAQLLLASTAASGVVR
jgi:uncharacterized membrane protein YhhN